MAIEPSLKRRKLSESANKRNSGSGSIGGDQRSERVNVKGFEDDSEIESAGTAGKRPIKLEHPTVHTKEESR